MTHQKETSLVLRVFDDIIIVITLVPEWGIGDPSIVPKEI